MKRIIYHSVVAVSLSLTSLAANAQSDYIVNTYEDGGSSSDSTAAVVADTPEEAFLAQHFPYISLCDWQPGMRFLVVPGEEDGVIRTFTDSITGREIGTADLRYKSLEYRGVEQTPRGWFRLNFYCAENEKSYYVEIRNFSFAEYCMRIHGGGVRGLAYLGDVDRARELLLGKDLWLKSPVVYRDSPSSSNGFVESQLPVDSHVRVERIGVGSREFPVKIVFRTDDGALYFNTVAMSRTNSALVNEDFIMDRTHHFFANAFRMESQADTKSAKMSERLAGKDITLRRSCKMQQEGGGTVTMNAARTFHVQGVRANTGTSYYTLTLASKGKTYRKDVTFENTNVAGNIDGNDESYFDELFSIGSKYVPSNSTIRRSYSGSSTRRGGGMTTTSVTESNGDFMNMMGGIISKGMTQEEVRMAKGDPERRHRLSSGGTQWDYYDGMKVQFNKSGRVSRIIRK